MLFVVLLNEQKDIFGASSDNVSGWAWSETIGWISFNNTSGGGSINYGVNINPSTGDFSGYAWSENIGWISFNRADTGNPPAAPYNGGSGTIANLDMTSRKVTGWARALSYAGGWDGWIKFGGGSSVWTNQVSVPIIAGPDEFRGWAWGNDVVGWISFNGINYKVLVDINFPPTVSCNDTETWNSCIDSRNPALSWNYSDPDGNPQGAYQIQIDNDSAFSAPITINITADPSSSNTYQPSGTTLNWSTRYYWRVKVKDNQGAWSNWCSPNCSFDTPVHAYPSVGFSWAPTKVSANDSVFFSDTSTCYDDNINGSDCSSVANGGNDSFSWNFDTTNLGQVLPFETSILENPKVSFSNPGDWQIELKITDKDGFMCPKIQSVRVSWPLPKWDEVIPK